MMTMMSAMVWRSGLCNYHDDNDDEDDDDNDNEDHDEDHDDNNDDADDDDDLRATGRSPGLLLRCRCYLELITVDFSHKKLMMITMKILIQRVMLILVIFESAQNLLYLTSLTNS